jgi:Peptidase family M23
VKAALLAMLALAPAQAGAFDIVFPVACTLGTDCFIQQYIDRDPGPGARDFTCGPLSYDGHDGTDIAVPTTQDMLEGVAVRAAAAGTVLRMRTSLPDNTAPGAPVDFPPGQDCGNGLVLDHGDGWQTQYCHMRQGSSPMRPGDRLTAGQPIGQIGLTGNTEFPHLHFTLRKDGNVVDPFAPAMAPDACSTAGSATDLWAASVPYAAGGLAGIGMADHVPSFDAIKHGLPPVSALPADAPAIVLWVHLFGHRAGDELQMTITGPDGPFTTQTETLDRTQARSFRATGRKLADRPRWPAGMYRAEAVLLRDGVDLGRLTSVIDIP